jgi:hypothetical protein
MDLKPWDKSALALIFILGGLFAFTDYYGPRDIWTFMGSGVIIMILSVSIGWVVNKLLTAFDRYKLKAEKIQKKVNPAVILGLICASGLLIKGYIEYLKY